MSVRLIQGPVTDLLGDHHTNGAARHRAAGEDERAWISLAASQRETCCNLNGFRYYWIPCVRAGRAILT